MMMLTKPSLLSLNQGSYSILSSLLCCSAALLLCYYPSSSSSLARNLRLSCLSSARPVPPPPNSPTRGALYITVAVQIAHEEAYENRERLKANVIHSTPARATVSQECITAYNDLKLAKKYKYVIFKLSDDNREIVVEDASDNKDWESFREKLVNATTKSKSVSLTSVNFGISISNPAPP